MTSILRFILYVRTQHQQLLRQAEQLKRYLRVQIPNLSLFYHLTFYQITFCPSIS